MKKSVKVFSKEFLTVKDELNFYKKYIRVLKERKEVIEVITRAPGDPLVRAFILELFRDKRREAKLDASIRLAYKAGLFKGMNEIRTIGNEYAFLLEECFISMHVSS